jgi:hypothetical protein
MAAIALVLLIAVIAMKWLLWPAVRDDPEERVGWLDHFIRPIYQRTAVGRSTKFPGWVTALLLGGLAAVLTLSALFGGK